MSALRRETTRLAASRADRAMLTWAPVLGVLLRNLEIEAPSRHLGLVPAAERDDAGIVAMGRVVAEHVDLDALLAIAQCPGGVPCTTVGLHKKTPVNAAMAAHRILKLAGL